MPRARTGSIDITPDGRHRVRVTVRGRRVPAGTFRTRAEAEDARTDLLAELARRGEEATGGQTVAAWGEKWIEGRELGGIIEDAASDRGRFRHISNDPIGALELHRLTRAHVVSWIGRLRDKPAREGSDRTLAVSSIKNALGLLRGMLGAAHDAGLVRDNVARGHRVPKAKTTSTEEPWTWLRPEELPRVVGAIKGPERHLVTFSAGTGLRAGELAAQREADIHEDHLIVRYGGMPDHPTKGGKPRRVPLFGIALDALRAWRAEAPAWYQRPRGEPWNIHGLAFPRRRGTPRSGDHIIRWAVWKAALKAAELGRTARWHDLRHTFASSLISGVWGRRWSLLEVRDVMGHTDIEVTQRYAHLAHDVLSDAARETEAAWRNGLELASAAAASPRKCLESLAPPTRIELVTFGLGRPSEGQQFQVLGLGSGRMRALCQAFVLATASRRDVSVELRAIRDELLSAFSNVLRGLDGEHGISNALRLAERVLEATEAAPCATQATERKAEDR